MRESSESSASDPAAILCVDDDAAVLRILARTLSGGFRVVTAADGAAALKLLDQSGPFAVVIADLTMPGMSGSTFLAEVRERAPETTRIMLTGCAHVGGARQVITDGSMFRFLAKPFSPLELLQVVRDGVQHHRTLIDGMERKRATG